MVGTTAGLGWLLLLSAPLADPAAAPPPSREQLLFMLEFSDAQGEFIDPFEVERIAESEQPRSSTTTADAEAEDADRD